METSCLLVSDLALEPVVRVSPYLALRDGARLLAAAGIGTLVVDDEGVPVGVLTLPAVITAVLGRASWIGAFRIALQVDGRV
jgi:CBS domain-containing protein